MSDKTDKSTITKKDIEEKIDKLLNHGFGRLEIVIFNHYIKSVSVTETMVSQVKET